MKIAVIGAGGVGGPFGAALARKGNDVTFVARGAHLAAMLKDGLKVEGVRGNTHLQPTKATDDPASIGPVDAVLLTVKLWDVESSAEQIRPLIGPQTVVVPLQNGIDAAERVAGVLGKEHVMGGVAQISATIDKPGHIRQMADFMRIQFGELDGGTSERGRRLLDACEGAGFDVELTPDIRRALWEKFVFLCGMSGITALTRQPIGPIREHAETRGLLEQIMREVTAVAAAKGIALAPDVVDKRLAALDGGPGGARASMAMDIVRGNRLEVPWLAGTVARLGRETGVPTPANAFVYAALKLYENGAPAPLT